MVRPLMLSAALLLSACVSTPTPNYVPIRTNLSFPQIGVETEVAIGEDMLRQGLYTETDGIITQSENNIKGYKISAGFYPQISEDKDNTYHRFNNAASQDGLGYIVSAKDFLGLPLALPESIRASKTKQETCVIVGGIIRPACDTQVPFTRDRKPAITERDFQQTLIYSGRVGNRIKIGYRESSGSIARQAFSNEAEYDLTSSMEIGYRGAKVRVISADNQKIKYVVLSNFNTK